MNEKNSTITLGDKDFATVKRIQIRLNLRGGGHIAEDGDFGLKTLQAIKAFQSSHLDKNGNPLNIDGEVGPLTWSCLFEIPITQNMATPPLIKELLKVAQNEIGVKEVPPRSNSGPRVEEYLKSVNLGPGYAWCAAFVFWCFKQASANLNCINPVLKTASCMVHWQKTKGMKITMEEASQNPDLIAPGDIFIIRRRGGLGHTGIITGISNGYIQTIEGNSNAFHSAEGEGVVALQRKIDTITAGFIKYI
jgi:hypothetical protein